MSRGLQCSLDFTAGTTGLLNCRMLSSITKVFSWIIYMYICTGLRYFISTNQYPEYGLISPRPNCCRSLSSTTCEGLYWVCRLPSREWILSFDCSVAIANTANRPLTPIIQFDILSSVVLDRPWRSARLKCVIVEKSPFFPIALD